MTQIGPYRVTRPLGRGGMGAVYLAYDTRLDREVALKLFSGPEATSAVAREQVLAEARAAAALNHPNIASVHDVLDVDGQVAIVFEYVEGETLADRLRRGRLTSDETVSIALQLTDALTAAHKQGIVHRDLKPANIAITSDGSVKVLDFGVARVMPPESGPIEGALTTVGGFVGTLGYAPPEQCLGQSVDARADLFSLGVILFEMLTMRRPFSGEDAVTVLQSMFGSEPPRVRSVVPDVPPELDGLIARLLAHDVTRRPASAQQVRDTLGSLAETDRAAVPPVAARPHRWVTPLLVASAVTAALVGTIVWNRPGPPPAMPVVAVIPLTNATADPSNDYLALGVADSLITRLAALPSVTVLSRSAVAEARSRKADLRALASELDATYLVDGTVQLAADQVRISLSLVLSDGSVAWAETVEGPFASIFSLQTRLASALGQAMSVQLSAADRASLAQQPTMSPEALAAYWRGRALLDRRDVPGNVAAAIASFESATRADPSYADAHAARGEALWALYLSSRDPEHARLAIVSGSEALRLEPGSAQVRYALALTLDGSGRPDEAVEELQRALVLRPTFEEARRRLAQILARQGHIDQAIAEFQKAIDLRPNSWANYSALGVSLVQAARYQEAVEAFSRVIELHPEGAIGHQQLGATYQMLGNHDAALDSYRKAIAIAPLPQAYSAMGALLHERGDYAGAVEAYDKAIELRPNSHVTHRNLGDAFRRLQRHRDAENAYRRAVTLVEAELEVNPTDAPSLAALAVYHAKLGDWTAARARCEEAERLAAGDTQVLYDAAVVYALQGRREEALSRLQRAVAAGYSPTVIASDDDFERLAGVPAFQQLIAPAAGAQEVK